MQIGFLTRCLRRRTLPEIIPWAGANGFHTLELDCWPMNGGAPNPSLDVQHLDQAQADALLALAKANGVTFACLTYCENTIAHDPAQREPIVQHLYKILDAAKLLGVHTVSTFIGRDETKTQAENFDVMEEVFSPLLNYASSRDVAIAIENCPMVDWQFEGLPGNLAYSPVIWDEMFRRLPHENFGLNFDPSHLAWMGVDYNQAAQQYGSKIFHTHAKDTQIYYDKRERYSIVDAGGHRWWMYRIPGRGEIDWSRWLETLRSIGYDGAVSLEHEDPDYEKTEELIYKGLVLGKQHLEATQRV